MRVVCIIDDWYDDLGKPDWKCPQIDEICLVVGSEETYSSIYYILDGYGDKRFISDNFRPLDESFADEVLERVKEEINKEELVLI